MSRGERADKDILHIDCFAGPGGITTGFRAAGIRTVLAVEKVESCVETFRANHAGVPVIHKDIRKVSRRDIREHFTSKADILTAGMPCETFSTAGSSSRSFYDDRQSLYREAIRIADITDSKFILLENVPGITSKKTTRGGTKLVIDEIFEMLDQYGYKHRTDDILDAASFGVPQHRERYFILAARQDLMLRFPECSTNHSVSVNSALAGLPLIEANEEAEAMCYTRETSRYSMLMRDIHFWKSDRCGGEVTYHIAPKHRKGTIERFTHIKQGEGLRDLFLKFDSSTISQLQAQRVLPKRWYIQRNRRLVGEEPSFTVTSHCLDELVHPTLNRAMTVREVARLQSFPDYYDFKGGPLLCPHIYETQDKYEQVGDAVPPLLAYRLGLTIREILEGSDDRK